jgi:hypothetical protein
MPKLKVLPEIAEVCFGVFKIGRGFLGMFVELKVLQLAHHFVSISGGKDGDCKEPAQAAHAGFSPLPSSQRNIHRFQAPLPRLTPAAVEIGEGRGNGEAASQRADASLSTMWGTGEV